MHFLSHHLDSKLGDLSWYMYHYCSTKDNMILLDNFKKEAVCTSVRPGLAKWPDLVLMGLVF